MILRKLRQLQHLGIIFILAVTLLTTVFAPLKPVFALSAEQRDLVNKQIYPYLIDTTTCGAASTTAGTAAPTSLSGSDGEGKTWNFFYSLMQSDVLTAAVVGNIHQESTFNPTIMEIGGNSNNPADAGAKGWGLAQWTPGSKVINIAKNNVGISKPFTDMTSTDEIMLAELQVIWWEMNNTAPTGQKDIMKGFLPLSSDLTAATEYFRAHYESGTLNNRQTYAKDALAKYGNGGAASSGGCATSNSISPDCVSAQAGARLLCAAKKYDPASYVWGSGHGDPATWHSGCTTIGPSCGVDCSGLVSMAVYDAYNVKLSQVVGDYKNDSVHWKQVSLNSLLPGDLVVPTSAYEHVEIVDHAVGDKVYTFGAHTANRPQPDQVGPTSWSRGGLYAAYRWTGA